MRLNSTQVYALELPDSTHWALVRLAATLEMSHTDYIANLLITHVEEELDRLETT